MLENNSIKVLAVVTDKVNSEKVYITEKDIALERPSLAIKESTVLTFCNFAICQILQPLQ